jgi:hypothetical protein
MEWNGATLMKEGGKGGGEECEVRRLEEEASEPKKRSRRVIRRTDRGG